jgi:triacylglycerol esterase/lipase EstA (alpha/beta hydrolase family)
VVKDFPAPEQPTWRRASQEILALIAAGALFPFGFGVGRGWMPRKAAQRTVVLVHGYLGNRSGLLPLAGYLRWRGLRHLLFFDYQSSRGVERGAITLRHYLRRHVGGGRIDLVCHSLGGLVARVYLQQLGGARRVDHCITLGTPHYGTYNSYWLSSRVGRELRPDSLLLSRLAERGDQAGRVRFLSIVAGSDHLVVPRVFSAYEEVVHLPEVGHMGLLFCPRVFRMIADRLSQDELDPLSRASTS